MTLDDELEKLELALDDHYDGYGNLVESIEETEDAQEALTHLVEIAEIQGDLGYSGEQVVKGVTTYLLDNREHMDTRALELKTNQDRLEEVLDNHASGDPGFADRVLEKWFGDYTLPTAVWKSEVRGEPDIDHNKRKTLAAMGGILGGGALTASAYDAVDGGGTVQSVGGKSTEAVEYNISDLGKLGTYFEEEVIGNRMLEQEWGDLLANYNPQSDEFFTEEDINLQSVDVVYDDRPREDSGYRTTAELNGQSQKSDWVYFEHDETARNALEYFGEL